MMARRTLLIPLALLLLLVGGYAVYWWVAADQADRAVDRWMADWRRAGYEVRSDGRTLGGFPGVVAIDLTRPLVRDPEGLWRWQGTRVRFEVRPWAPTEYRVELFGPNAVTAPVAGRPVDFDLEAARAVGAARIEIGGPLRRASLTFDDLSVESPELDLRSGAARLVATLDLPAAPPTDAESASAELMLTGDDVRLPERHAGPLGHELETLSTRLRLMGPMPRAGLRRALEQWRAAGGHVETPWLRVGWGPLGLDAEGTLSLDRALRPIGSYKARISGFEGAIARFRDAGMIDPTAARLLAGGARLFSSQGSDGRATIEMPLTAEEGGLFLGPIRVAELRPVLPPEAPPTPSAEPAPPPGNTAPTPGPVQQETLPEIAEPPTVAPNFPAAE